MVDQVDGWLSRFYERENVEGAILVKEEIIEILNGCSDLKLKTYVMLLAYWNESHRSAISKTKRFRL